MSLDDALLADRLIFKVCRLIAAFLVFFIIETLADEQHWRFQSLKHSLTGDQRAKHADEDIRIGFYRHGLFRYSRHPNYFGEQVSDSGLFTSNHLTPNMSEYVGDRLSLFLCRTRLSVQLDDLR